MESSASEGPNELSECERKHTELAPLWVQVRSVRGEIDRREAAGQFVAGRGGGGGAHAMRTPEERARRQKAIVGALPSSCPCNRTTLLPRVAPRQGRLLAIVFSLPIEARQMRLPQS